MSRDRAAGRGSRPGVPAALLVLLLFWGRFFPSLPVMAAAAPSERHFLLTGEDGENGFRYEAEGVGAISSSVRAGETAAVAVITADPGCILELFCNGERQQYENGDLLYETGAYELRVSPPGEADGIFAGFSFTIENQFGEDEAAGRAVVEEDPELLLSYDNASGMYRYQFPDGGWWEMNVPSGGIISRPASLRLSAGCSVFTVQKDGEEELPPENLTFLKEGRYRMEVVGIKGGSGGREASIYKAKVSFIVGTDRTDQMTVLNAPTGFSIRFADPGGRRVKPDGKTYLRLRTDGRYRIAFMPDTEGGDSRIRWQRDGAGVDEKADYELEFFRDTTPPYLIFSQPVNQRRIRGTVSCTSSEEDCTLSVKYNGTPAPDAKSPFSFGGSYEVTVCDQAGNGRTYTFYIENQYALMDDRWIILSAALIIAAAAYMAYSRRNLRIL